jgi:hypothetical protein
MTSRVQTWVFWSAVAVLSAIYLPIFLIGFISPRYFLDPVEMSLDQESMEMIAVRRTEASRDFNWLEVTASWYAEATALTPDGFRTCPEPKGSAVFEIIGGAENNLPIDITRYSVDWMEPCICEETCAPVTYSGYYVINVHIKDGYPFAGWSVKHPRTVSFSNIFYPEVSE